MNSRLVDVKEGCVVENIISINFFIKKRKRNIFNFNLIKEICLLFLLYIVLLFFIYFYYSHTLVLAAHNFLLISSIYFRLFPCDRIIIWIYSCDENYGKRVIKFVIIILLIHRKKHFIFYFIKFNKKFWFLLTPIANYLFFKIWKT